MTAKPSTKVSRPFYQKRRNEKSRKIFLSAMRVQRHLEKAQKRDRQTAAT